MIEKSGEHFLTAKMKKPVCCEVCEYGVAYILSASQGTLISSYHLPGLSWCENYENPILTVAKVVFRCISVVIVLLVTGTEWPVAIETRTSQRIQILDASFLSVKFVREMLSDDVAIDAKETVSLNATNCAGCISAALNIPETSPYRGTWLGGDRIEPSSRGPFKSQVQHGVREVFPCK